MASVAVERLESPSDPAEPRLLHLDCGSVPRAKVVLVATGVRWRKLPALGADQFEGAGVLYVCIAVEAVNYDSRDLAVVGGGNSAGQAALHLAECCRTRRVNRLLRGRLGDGMSDYLVSRLRGAANVSVHEGSEIESGQGRGQVDAVILRDGTRLDCAGVFVFIGTEPVAGWLPEGVARDRLGCVHTGADAVQSGKWPRSEGAPSLLGTTVPGILAAGDVREGATKRVGSAVGDGSLAVTCPHSRLAGSRR